MFSPETFMNAVITDANDTVIKPCPVGEYVAQITKVEPKSGTISKGERAGEPWARLDVFCEINDMTGQVKAATGRDKVTVKYGVMLDLTPAGGLDLGEGKNVNLGRLRDAVNQNVKGAPWTPSMLVGPSLKVTVQHRIDERDGQTVYAEVSRVAKLA